MVTWLTDKTQELNLYELIVNSRSKWELLNKQRTVNYDYPYPVTEPPTHGSLFIYVVVLNSVSPNDRNASNSPLCSSKSRISSNTGNTHCGFTPSSRSRIWLSHGI